MTTLIFFFFKSPNGFILFEHVNGAQSSFPLCQHDPVEVLRLPGGGTWTSSLQLKGAGEAGSRERLRCESRGAQNVCWRLSEGCSASATLLVHSA